MSFNILFLLSFRLTYVRKMAAPTQIWFDPTRILKEGYLTKSPPLTEETLIRKRFRLRWFVLCYVGVEPTLFYFKDEKYRKQGKPKGILFTFQRTDILFFISVYHGSFLSPFVDTFAY